MVGQAISHCRIIGKLGEGGMGPVYKAEDTKLERTVALKFLAGHLLNDEEEKAAARLDHSNICTAYEIGEAEGRTYVSTAFLEGEPLEARIERGPLSPKDVLDIDRQVADGLVVQEGGHSGWSRRSSFGADVSGMQSRLTPTNQTT